LTTRPLIFTFPPRQTVVASVRLLKNRAAHSQESTRTEPA